MAKSAKKKKRCSARAKKVWHVTDFRELFELPDDLRKKRIGPLSYTKSFVSLTGKSEAHEIKHCERLAELKSHNERHLLRSVFEDLKNFSGKKALAHRGYLVTTAELPAGFDYLASQLKMEVAELKKAVPILEQIGLIERISMNGFTGGAGPKKARRRAGKKRKSEQSGTVRNSPERSGKRRKTLKKRKGNQSNDKSNSNEDEGTKHSGSGKVKEEEKSRQGRGGVVSANVLESKSANNEATSQPTRPRISAKAGGHILEFPVPPPAVFDDCDIGKHRYSDGSKDFAGGIFSALDLQSSFSPLTVRGRRELGSFASVWEGVEAAGLSPPVLDELRARALTEATKLARRGKRCRNVSAVFCHVFSRLLAAACAGRKEMGGCA